MGKVYLDTVKYIIYARVEINGLVEKPDIIGAIFGQTEGLIGEELDLRELQKNGRIGRIEVNLHAKGGKTIGEVTIPSSLDVVDTSVIAAAVETVERVGPCEAKFSIIKVEDVRNVKRKIVIERAKEIVKKLLSTEIPESREITDLIRNEVKKEEVTTYGPEKLPAGPNLDEYDEIILVEGRADVINLLKNGINNVIAVGGVDSKVPESIVNLSRKKTITLFVDGDRGGELIFKNLINQIEIDYLARAPIGSEVEELSRKEIIKALRLKIPIQQIIAKKEERYEIEIPVIEESKEEKVEKTQLESGKETEEIAREKIEPADVEKEIKSKEAKVFFFDVLKSMEGSLNAKIFDKDLNLIKEVPVRDVTENLDGAYAVVLDGIITQRIIDLAEVKNVKIIVGVNKGNIFRIPKEVKIYSLNE
jgi:DNA primase